MIRGTTITLYLNEDSTEFANEFRAKEVIDKYCSFMPYEIYLDNEDDTEEKTQMIDKDELLDTDTIIETVKKEAKLEEQEDEDGNKKMVEVVSKIIQKPHHVVISSTGTRVLMT